MNTQPVPDEVLTAGCRTFSSAAPAATLWCELLGYRQTLHDLSAMRTGEFPGVPTRLLTATGDLHRAAGLRWLRRHEQLATELGARHRLLPEAGHLLAWERPEVVAAAVRDVLAARR